jgi:predicted metal-binding membrane protein
MRAAAEERPAQRALLGISALLFMGSALTTFRWSTSMSAMGGLAMPGGWTMSMMWMRMPGQTWPGMAASFLEMWTVMMTAMMLPSLSPMLWRYRLAVATTGGARLGRLTATVGTAYLVVWTVFGLIAFLTGLSLASLVMQRPDVARVVPMAIGAAVLFAGILQLSEWKARHLVRCRESPGAVGMLSADAGTAWRHGLRIGLHCCGSSMSLMMALLAIGVMDLRAMVAAGGAIAAERLALRGQVVSRVVGALLVAAGLYLVARGYP